MLYDMLKDASLGDATKRAIVSDFDRVFSLDLTKRPAEEKTPAADETDAWILQKIAERAEAKRAKNYALADAIRAELLEKGIVLTDTKDGTTYSR